MTRTDNSMLKHTTDRSLALALVAALLASFLALVWDAHLLATAAFLVLFVLFLEIVNRHDTRASMDAVRAAFAALDQVHSGKRWMGSESEIILCKPTESFSWKLLCRTRRGIWFETIVHMSGVAHVERMDIREISANEAALALQHRTEIYAKYFGQPDAA